MAWNADVEEGWDEDGAQTNDNGWNVDNADMFDQEFWDDDDDEDDDFPSSRQTSPNKPGKLKIPQFSAEQREQQQHGQPKPSRLSADIIHQLENRESGQAKMAVARPVRKLSEFQVQFENESEVENRERLQREKEEFARLMKDQVASRTAEERARLQALERNERETEIQRKAEEEKRRRRDDELKKARAELVLKRKKQEEALRVAQKKYEEEKQRKADISRVREEDLVAQQKQLLSLQAKLREEEEKLRHYEVPAKKVSVGDNFQRPVFEEFEIGQEERVQCKLRFIVNPQWGIDSLVRRDGAPRVLVQMRRLKHLTHAPQNLQIQKPCVLVVFSDSSLLCARERDGLRALFPPCDNLQVISGPSLSKAWETMFSLRFDDLGPYYFHAASAGEARYWISVFGAPVPHIVPEAVPEEDADPWAAANDEDEATVAEAREEAMVPDI